jgi:ribosomal protein S18 acetylase RimI-like enzyme
VSPLEFRRATPAEVDDAAAVIEDAIAWSAARGLASWGPGEFADPEGWGRQRLLEALEVGGLHLAWRDGAPVATFSLLPEDPVFWPGAPPDALYLHRFAVRAAHAGSGIGAAALAWMAGETRRAGRRFIRLDALGDNRGIRAYYERVGFAHRGDVVVRDLPFALYEWDLDRAEHTPTST